MQKNTQFQSIVLASSSPYRRELLFRLQLAFTCESPEVDESVFNDKPAEQMVVHLATEKARKIAIKYPSSLVIGSDQVALLGSEILTKPGNHENAVIQLQKISNKTVVFQTGLCVLNTTNNTIQTDSIPYTVKFRNLELNEIERYLTKEQPYNCAGSFKSEGLGITLLEYMHGDDPTALIGLPLIRLSTMLKNEGVEIP